MYLSKARVQNYRSIRDTGGFDVEQAKTILVGPNEAGKTTVLRALESINPPGGASRFEWLRDYPRALLNDIQRGKIKPEDVTVAEATFALDEDDQALIEGYLTELGQISTFTLERRLDNSLLSRLDGGPYAPTYNQLKVDLARLVTHLTGRAPDALIAQYSTLTSSWSDRTYVYGTNATNLKAWLESIVGFVDDTNTAENERLDRLTKQVAIGPAREGARDALLKRAPVFVYYSNYFQVRPVIHLSHLAARIEQNILDDESYDFGNKCLLQLLGFTARELANLGSVPEPPASDAAALKAYRDQLDRRTYSLNAASVQLTNQVKDVWIGDDEKGESVRLRLHADQQYLKVVSEDELGVEVELDQRSAGFQWLVSFFVVFRAQAEAEYKNAILLLDEPGLSLHGLKQRQFRHTVTKLAEFNQTIYSTHSPFMVGPDELQLVRVVEMANREAGTKVHTHVTADDPRSLYPLQAALGYDLAQSLFAQQRNLVCEGLTDYWYLDGTAALLRDSQVVDLNSKIALVPAGAASKVVYYATLLHAQGLKVAALLDSDQEGERVATQDEFVQLLGTKQILRTKDVYDGPVKRSEIEDLLRSTLVDVAKTELSWDVSGTASTQPGRPIVDIFEHEIADFSKYRLAKAYLWWTAGHSADDLTVDERRWWESLINTINKTLR